MSLFEKQVEKEGGTLKKFKDYAINLELPSTITPEALQRVLKFAGNKFGKENLIVHKLEKEGKTEITFFRKNTVLKVANKIAGKFGLQAEIIEDAFSVGVGGDMRTYTPVVNISGPFPGWDCLEKVSNEITNILPINRVTYEVK